MEVGIYLSPLAVGTLHGLPLQDVIWSSACCRLNTLQCSQVCWKQLAHVTEGNCINLPLHYCCYITYCMFYDLITKDYYGWFRLEKIIILRASALIPNQPSPALSPHHYLCSHCDMLFTASPTRHFLMICQLYTPNCAMSREHVMFQLFLLETSVIWKITVLLERIKVKT